MPTYKGAAYIRKSIDSILAQTFKDFELLIINDCSPDNTDEIVESYTDFRIRYIKNARNLGISASSNLGISLAKGKYIARQDHDDIAFPNRLQLQYEYMETHPDIGVCGTGFRTFEKKHKTVIHPQDNTSIKAYLLFKCALAHQTTLIRKELLQQHNLRYDETFQASNDRKLWIDAAPYTKFHNLPIILLKYRVHKDMTSKTKKSIVQKEATRLRHIIYKCLNIELNDKQLEIADNYLFRGRARIKEKNIIKQIEELLLLFINANNQTNCFDTETFNNICGKYFHKRCVNYCFFSCRSAKKLYNNSPLKQYDRAVSKPHKLMLNILNFIFFE